MKRRLILSLIVICLGLLANITLHSLISTSKTSSETDIKPSSISSYTLTNFNLLTDLKKFGESKLNSKLGFSNLNPWLNYYYRTGTIRANKEHNSYVFFNDSNVPIEFRSDVNSAHINASGILFIRHDKLSEQSLDIWNGTIYAVADNGMVYAIPKEEKKRFVNHLKIKQLDYERMQNFIWYKNNLLKIVLFLLFAIWLVPLYHSIKYAYFKLRSIASFEFKISFKYKK